MRSNILVFSVFIMLIGCAGTGMSPQIDPLKGTALLECKYFLFGSIDTQNTGGNRRVRGNLSAGEVRGQVEDFFAGNGFEVITKYKYDNLPDEEKKKVLTSSCSYYWHLDYGTFPGNNMTVIRFSLSLYPKTGERLARYKRGVGFGGEEIFNGIFRPPAPSGEAISIALDKLTKFMTKIRKNSCLGIEYSNKIF
ncbi:hypothetical protein ACFL6O_00050 [candidate division KSB1 bacterium]